MLNDVTIIIPCAPDETEPKQLLQNLKATQAEIIISSEGSRAKSLNAGAKKAQRDVLWFLHADSLVSRDNIEKSNKAIIAKPNALHYFDLQFDSPGLVQLNGEAANIRSRLFGLPYGDQGLCISKAGFETIGGYPEDVHFGEDVLFVRQAKKHGVKLNRIPSRLKTSARKYRKHGWLNVTIAHQKYIFNLMRQKL